MLRKLNPTNWKPTTLLVVGLIVLATQAGIISGEQVGSVVGNGLHEGASVVRGFLDGLDLGRLLSQF